MVSRAGRMPLVRSLPCAHAPVVVPLQPRGTEAPFIFVHPLGGMVFCYAPLARRLGRKRPFLALQSPGLERGEGMSRSIEEMADGYAESVRRVRPTGPYLLGGWSFGGVVAFEMARRLAENGHGVPLLALIDSRAALPREAHREWRDQDLLDLITRELGVDRTESIHSAFPGLKVVIRAHLEALKSYRPGAYAGAVRLLRAAGAGSDTGDPTLGWGAYCSRGVESHELDADHFTILREPAVDVVAEKLEAWSEAALQAAPDSDRCRDRKTHPYRASEPGHRG
jgi:thioesterase domain-containing protein